MRDKFYDGFVGYGELTEMDREFLRPDFDVKRQRGPIYVGYYNVVTSKRPDLKDDRR